jgi:hypothetical protein
LRLLFAACLLPLLRPGFIAGWIILATIYLREFSTSVFLYSPGSRTARAFALSLLCRWQPWAHVLFGFDCQRNLYNPLILVARRIGKVGHQFEDINRQ